VFKNQERLQYFKGLIFKDVGLLVKVIVIHKPFYVFKHIMLIIAKTKQLIGLVLAKVCY
jgi:hypothetical protein